MTVYCQNEWCEWDAIYKVEATTRTFYLCSQCKEAFVLGQMNPQADITETGVIECQSECPNCGEIVDDAEIDEFSVCIGCLEAWKAGEISLGNGTLICQPCFSEIGSIYLIVGDKCANCGRDPKETFVARSSDRTYKYCRECWSRDNRLTFLPVPDELGLCYEHADEFRKAFHAQQRIIA